MLNLFEGSILAVTSSNVHAVTRTTKFVGICIRRQGSGLNSSFLLRNVVDNQGLSRIWYVYMEYFIDFITHIHLKRRKKKLKTWISNSLIKKSKKY